MFACKGLAFLGLMYSLQCGGSLITYQTFTLAPINLTPFVYQELELFSILECGAWCNEDVECQAYSNSNELCYLAKSSSLGIGPTISVHGSPEDFYTIWKYLN